MMETKMLSPKARAFSVDELLNRREIQEKGPKGPVNVQLGGPTEKVREDGIHPDPAGKTTGTHGQVAEVADVGGACVRVELCQADLWQAFHDLGTEMIITKTGRRMFPAVRVRVTGLKAQTRYRASMDFIPVDKHKYRYVYHSSRWMIAGHGETMRADQNYEHPESPLTGEALTAQVLSFEKIKLTNSDVPTPGQVSLLSMQKFQPRIRIQEQSDTGGSSPVAFTFSQTAFIAVTAYQNQEITRLKIARNPFAKGFREAGKCRSSLEAMMASFGVVIDSNKGHTPAVKRKYEDSGPDNPSSSSSPNFVHTFRPGLNGAAGHTVPVQLQNMFPTTGNVSFVPSSPSPVSLPFPVAQFTSPNTSTGLDSGKGVQLPFPYSLDLGHSSHQKDMQCQQLHSLPFCILPNTPFTEVHPAFRFQTNSQLDYNLLNSYYKTCSSYAALPHMLVPSYAGHTTQLFNGDIKKENIETNSGSAYKHESDGALNLCKT